MGDGWRRDRCVFLNTVVQLYPPRVGTIDMSCCRSFNKKPSWSFSDTSCYDSSIKMPLASTQSSMTCHAKLTSRHKQQDVTPGLIDWSEVQYRYIHFQDWQGQVFEHHCQAWQEQRWWHNAKDKQSKMYIPTVPGTTSDGQQYLTVVVHSA